MSDTVVVAGGGITGLAAAYYVQKQAHAAGRNTRILVVEKDNRLAGTTQTDIIEGAVIEHGPDSFLAHKPWLTQLCNELGLKTVGTNPQIRSTYIYHKGRLERLPVGMQIMIPTEIWPFVTTRLISPLGKLRAALEPLMPIKRTDEDESIGSFVSRRFGREVLTNIAGPLMGGIHGGDWDAISLKASFPQFIKMEKEQGSLLLAGQRSKAHKPKGPTGSTFLTVPTGLHSIAEKIVEATPAVNYQLGVALTRVVPSGRQYYVELSGGQRILADAVILALPAHASAAAISEFLPDTAAELNGIPYSSSCVVALLYDKTDVKHPLDASGFLVPHTEPMDVTASTWVSSKWPHACPPDRVLLRCFLGRGTGRDWTVESDETIAQAVRQGLAKTMGLRAEPLHTSIYRWPHARPVYQVGHLERIDRVDRQMAQVSGLYLAGAAHRGVGLPNCVLEGKQAAEKVAKHLGWE